MTVHSVLNEYRYRVINKSITELTEQEIYSYIFDPKTIPEISKKENMTTFILKKLRGEDVEVFCTRMFNILK